MTRQKAWIIIGLSACVGLAVSLTLPITHKYKASERANELLNADRVLITIRNAALNYAEGHGTLPTTLNDIADIEAESRFGVRTTPNRIIAEVGIGRSQVNFMTKIQDNVHGYANSDAVAFVFLHGGGMRIIYADAHLETKFATPSSDTEVNK